MPGGPDGHDAPAPARTVNECRLGETVIISRMTAAERLYQLLLGYRITQAIRAAALLGVCDALAAGPRASSTVAAEIDADPGLVHRLMQALAAIGLCTATDDRLFANTELGDLLRRDVPGSLRSTVIGMGEDSWWAAWAQFPRAISGGGIPFELANGKEFWQEMAEAPVVADRFNAFMSGQTENFLPRLLNAFEFSGVRHVVDVGGGSGALLVGILQAHRDARGTLFDLPSGLTAAPAYLRAHGVADRCDVVEGSFFDSVPSGGDVYILRLILHDWPDDRAGAILATCRHAMSTGASLLVIDAAMPEHASADPAALVKFLYDLHMYVLFGARERTEPEMRRILQAASFRVDRVVPTEPAAIFIATAC